METTAPEASAQEQLLSQTLMSFSQWRLNKTHQAEPIPNKLWEQIFALEKWYSPAEIKSFFRLTSKQYTARQQAMCLSKTPSETHDTERPVPNPQGVSDFPELCEVNVKDNPPATTPPKVNPYALNALPSAKTIVIELCRVDGEIMKIHTTEDSIPTLLNTFLGR